MPLFPAFIDLSGKKVLVVGGGEVALRKVSRLLPFTRNITIVAPQVRKELVRLAREHNIRILKRRFFMKDLKGRDLVIVAVDNIKLQERVYRECERRKILCNSVDSPEYCNFIFPSLVVRDDLVIGITTGGKAPALSKRVREIVEGSLPDNIVDILKEVSAVREKLPKGLRRQEVVKRLVNRLLPPA